MQLAPLALAVNLCLYFAMLLKTFLAMYLESAPSVGDGQRSILTRIQGDPIASKNALKLTPKDYIDHFVLRSKTVTASTANHDAAYLRGALEYGKLGMGIEGISAKPLEEAMPILRKRRLIGQSGRRSQMPTEEQTVAIAALMRTKGESLKADLTEFQYRSGRRISESCGLEWGGWDDEKMTALVKNMKHPRMKVGHDVRVAVPKDAAEIIRRQMRLTNNPTERIFKVRSKTFQATYRSARRELGFHEIHLHDSRRAYTTNELRKGTPVPKIMLVTGHLTREMVQSTYNGMKAEDYHKAQA